MPKDPHTNFAFHIDANLFSKFIENKFKDKVEIIDDVVLDFNYKNNSKQIKNLILKNNGTVEGDFFIDASGFQRILFSKLSVEWQDMRDWLPIDRCIPNPLEFQFKKQPPYTISEASDQGWILQVPLTNRWGTGYLFCSKFIDEDKAFGNFENFLQENYNRGLTNTSKVLKFESGFYKQQWVGNCICIGLSSGFAEPLEATNIHHTIQQIMYFTKLFNFKVFDHDVNTYNIKMERLYRNIYLYLRFCYCTNRRDSDFWNYMTNNIPKEVKDIVDKISNDIPTNELLPDNYMFNSVNFLKVGYGLKMIDKENYLKILKNRSAIEIAREESTYFDNVKRKNEFNSIDHRLLIDSIISNK